MQKPFRYYNELPPDLVDMSDPDTPESIKIRARIAIENQQAAKQSEKEQEHNRETKGRLHALFSFLCALIPFLQGFKN